MRPPIGHTPATLYLALPAAGRAPEGTARIPAHVATRSPVSRPRAELAPVVPFSKTIAMWPRWRHPRDCEQLSAHNSR